MQMLIIGRRQTPLLHAFIGPQPWASVPVYLGPTNLYYP